MNILIKKVRIRNFRSIKDLTIELGETTVLVGKNDCGKSNIIKAIIASLTLKKIKRLDVYHTTEDTNILNKEVTIDLYIVPNSSNTFSKSFKELFKDYIYYDKVNKTEFFSFRSSYIFKSDKGECIEKYNILFDFDNEELSEEFVEKQKLAIFKEFFINAERTTPFELAKEIHNEKSEIKTEKSVGSNNGKIFSYVCKRINNALKENNDTNIPLLLVEEPENHFHPQAQRKLLYELEKINVQKIYTSHSSYIINQVGLENIVYVYLEDNIQKCSRINLTEFTYKEKNNILDFVTNFKSEIIFSDAVILVEGLTEVNTFPIYFKKYFGKETFQLGVSIIEVGGSRFYPFTLLLNSLNIKWYLFCDGEKQTISLITNILTKLNDLNTKAKIDNYDNIFIIDNNEDIESYLVNSGYIEEAIKVIKHNKNDLYDYSKDFKKVIDRLKNDKVKYGKALADLIVKRSDESAIPKKVRDLFDKLKEDLL